jgi:hydroxymethylpyrimidine/phosphomethylpyrimidine kinase
MARRRRSSPRGSTISPERTAETAAGSPRSERREIPRALSIAGSDSGGGAGIQADLRTFAALGVWGMTAITAVTVQNSRGVTDVVGIPPEIVGEQIRAVVTDIGVDAAKTGMLWSAEVVEAVARAISDTGVPNLVVDPVFMSKHGHALLRPDAVAALRAEILPLATLVTPNLPEAGGLAGFEVTSRDAMRRAADVILGLGPGAVLVKGGHLMGDHADDLLLTDQGEDWVEGVRIDMADTHGTGCTLSAAAAAQLALGATVVDAVRSAKRFVTEAIRHALALGDGIGPVDAGWPLSRRGERGRP